MGIPELEADHNTNGGLGQPTEGVRVNPDGTGQRRAYEKGVLYFHPGRDVGGFVPFGPVWELWRSYGWERGALGYPNNTRSGTIAVPGFGSSDRAIRFEKGRIFEAKNFLRSGIRVLWYNTALITVSYNWSSDTRAAHVERLIEYLQSQPWDVICLGELFDNDERGRVAAEMNETHPYSHSGPREWGLHEDGGLLILSRFPMTATSQTIFRAYEGEDGLADKGVLHARLRIPSPTNIDDWAGDPNDPIVRQIIAAGAWSVDVFATHLQANPSVIGSRDGASEARKAQARQVGSFVEATSQRQVPAILVGDFNNDFDVDSTDFLERLSRPRDQWALTHPGVPGSTVPDDRRIDAVFCYHGYDRILTPDTMKIERPQAEYRGGDLSDHFALDVTFASPWGVRPALDDPPGRVVGRLSSTHAIQTTSGAGDDEVEVWFGAVSAANERQPLGDFSTGQFKEHDPTDRIRAIVDIEENVAFGLRAHEEDRWIGNPDAYNLIGRGVATVPGSHAALMADPNSQRTGHPFALMTGDGSQYAFRMHFDSV